MRTSLERAFLYSTTTHFTLPNIICYTCKVPTELTINGDIIAISARMEIEYLIGRTKEIV